MEHILVFHDIERLRDLAYAATPGKWGMASCMNRNHIGYYIAVESGDIEERIRFPYSAQMKANAEFVSAARPEVMLALLDRLDGLERENMNLEREKEFLERQADWLARHIGRSSCIEKQPAPTCMDAEYCKACWRKAAKEAVEEMENENQEF